MSNFWRELPKPFTVLAPMEGVTDYVFREVVANYLPKPDVMFTEFTNVDALTSKGYDKTIPRFKFSEAQRPIVAQIWGTNPENFFKSAQLIKDLKFDGIDINMGCPDRAVVKIGAGSALIDNRPLVKEIIEATKKGAKNLPISVKTRIGYKEIVTEDWIQFLFEQKIDAISIHARTAKQMSKVPANWGEIGKVVKLRNKSYPNICVIGNGDVESYSQSLKYHKKYGVDGVMIGRGIFKNPWVFESVDKVHSRGDYIQILLKHLDLYEENIGTNNSFDTLKKFFKMYINGFPGSSNLRRKLMEV